MNQKIRIGPITVGVSGLLFCLSCGIPLRRDGTGVEPRIAGGEIRAILLAELRQRAVIHPTPDSSNTRFVDDSSAVAPGMMYHWGIYSPPLRPEVHFTALVAERKGAVSLISMLSDWIDAAGEFIPQSVDDVLLACREMIQATALPRSRASRW